MREIKFRAWDKEAETMLTVRDINFCGEEIDTYEMEGDWIGFNFVELMQYTGLKDKNGREIYEGDIVQAWSQGVCRTFEIRWRQGGSPCWILYPAYQNGGLWYLHGTEHEDGSYSDMVEIIGNIYDNPELLEQNVCT